MTRVSLISALLALASCASTRPVVYSDSTTVSAADIQIAIELVQQRCLRERRGFLYIAARITGSLTPLAPLSLYSSASEGLGILPACRSTPQIQNA